MSSNRTNCPICRTSLIESPQMGGAMDMYLYNCPCCGRFNLTGSADAIIPNRLASADSKLRAAISHFIRVRQGTNPPITLDSKTFNRLEEEAVIPNVFEQMENLLRHFAEESKDPGIGVDFSRSTGWALIGAISPDAAYYCLQALEHEGYLSSLQTNLEGDSKVQLSPRGWQKFEEIRRGHTQGRRAFMAMKFGDDELDALFSEHMRPAVLETGFDLVRLDDNPKAGLIDDRLRVEIKSSRLLIADLTHANEGAYWEAGYAEGLGKPVIYTCSKKVFDERGTHFDTNHHLTVLWDSQSPIEACDKLKATIRNTIPEAVLVS